MKGPEFRFNVLIEETDGVFIAHCLEMGLVATADQPDDLPSIMGKLVSRQVEFALRNNNPSDIYHPAPPEIWEKFHRAIQVGKATEVDHNQKPVRNWPGIGLDQVSYASYAC